MLLLLMMNLMEKILIKNVELLIQDSVIKESDWILNQILDLLLMVMEIGLIVVDNKGNEIDGDKILALFAKDLLKNKKLIIKKQ